MTQTDVNLDDIAIEPTEPALLALLKRVAEYRGPGYEVTVLDRWEDVLTLQERGLITYGQEPMGVYDDNGFEVYGGVAHVTCFGDEELMVWAAREAA